MWNFTEFVAVSNITVFPVVNPPPTYHLHNIGKHTQAHSHTLALSFSLQSFKQWHSTLLVAFIGIFFYFELEELSEELHEVKRSREKYHIFDDSEE